MAIVGIGIDLVQISRIKKITARWESQFLGRIFTKTERQYCLQKNSPHIHFSGRFAIKEAMLKALGTGLRDGIKWQEIETLSSPSGKPIVRLSGCALELADHLKISGIWGSISHDDDYAIGQVILEGLKKT